MSDSWVIKRKWIWILIILIALVGSYFYFFYSYSCDTLECYRAHQVNCDKTKFVNDIEDATWSYKIIGKRGGDCRVDVKLLQVRRGDIELEKLQGFSMKCDIPKGSFTPPESDLENCHGILKEGLQQVVIQKMHSYLISNLGDISSELTTAI